MAFGELEDWTPCLPHRDLDLRDKLNVSVSCALCKMVSQANFSILATNFLAGLCSATLSLRHRC